MPENLPTPSDHVVGWIAAIVVVLIGALFASAAIWAVDAIWESILS